MSFSLFTSGADDLNVNYELDKTAILKHVICTNRQSGIVRRQNRVFIFMRMGLLYIIPRKIDTIVEIINFVENELRSSTILQKNLVFFLSPGSRVVYEEGSQVIKLYAANPPVLEPWRSTTAIQGMQKLKLSFTDVNTACQFHGALVKMLNFYDFTKAVAQDVNNDNLISESIHKAIWDAMLSCNTSNFYKFMDFYLNKFVNVKFMRLYVNNHDAESDEEYLTRINDNMDGPPLMHRLFGNVHEMFDVNEYPFNDVHGSVVAYSLTRFTQSNVFVRAMLLYVRFAADIRRSINDPSEIEFFSENRFPNLKDAIKESVNYLLPIRILHIFLASLPTDSNVLKAILKLLGRIVGSEELSKTATNREINWKLECKYMVPDPLMLSLADYELALKSPLWILYYLLKTKLNSMESGEFTETMLLLPNSILSQEFLIENNGTLQKPFINLIIGLEDPAHRQSILRALRDKSKFNSVLFQGFLSEGLQSGHFDETKHFVASVLFPSNCQCFYSSDFDVNVKDMNEAPIVIVKVLFSVLTSRSRDYLNEDCCRLLLSFCLRFENCSSRGISGMRNISSRIKSDPNGSLSTEVRYLLEQLDMARYIYFNLSPLVEELYAQVQGTAATDTDTDYSNESLRENEGAMEDSLELSINIVGSGSFIEFPVSPISNISHKSVNSSYSGALTHRRNSAGTARSFPPSPPPPSHPRAHTRNESSSFSNSSYGDQISTSGAIQNYSKDNFERLLNGLFSFSLWAGSPVFAEFLKRFGNDGIQFISKVFPAGSSLRPTLISTLESYKTIPVNIREKLSRNHLWNDGRHFLPEAIELISTVKPSPALFAKIVCAVLKLDDYKNLSPRVDTFLRSLLKSSDMKEDITNVILDTVERYSRKEVASLKIETLNDCINITANVLTLLNRPGDDEARAKMKALLCDYIRNQKPSMWITLFQGAHTIAIFIKYMSREDHAKAFRKFAELNESNNSFLSILDKVKKIFTAPIVTPDQLDGIMRLGANRAEAVNTLVENIKTIEYNSPITKFLSDLSADWMKFMHDSPLAIPLPPRNTQLITAMSCIQWSSSIISKGCAFIGQVGTGEGKSLIIAMLAVYFTKVMKKKVHIIENNASLLEKDYAQFENFYSLREVSVTKRFKNHNADVTYCLHHDPKGVSQDLDSYYREKVFAGEEPFKDTYLIVDEVDELIVDNSPNHSYVKEVTNSGQQLIECFDALAVNGIKPSNVPEYIWKEAEDGYNKGRTKVEYKLGSSNVEKADYVRYDNDIYAIEGGKIKFRRAASWLSYLEYTLLHKRDICVQTNFFYQCMPHMMSQYTRIIGLSGSIGSESEIKFLERTYHATKFHTPAFLDTCKDSDKPPPTLINGNVHVCTTKSSQLQAIINMAFLKFVDVPVLIIAASAQSAILIENALKESCSEHLPSSMEASDVIQLFLEYDQYTSEKMPYTEIIEKATALVSADSKIRRITVTDGFGGRGHDFAVYDEHVDNCGGLAIIVTDIPVSERDWVQWLGRTARSDRRGQYAVILSKTDEPVHSFPDLRNYLITEDSTESENFYTSELIKKLLEVQDKNTDSRIDGLREEIERGQLANELCDHYYKLIDRPKNSETWPSCDTDEKLSRFLEAGRFTTTSVEEFKRSINLHYDSVYS